VAARDPSRAQPSSPEDAIASDCFQRVLGTTRREAAARRQRRRNEPL